MKTDSDKLNIDALKRELSAAFERSSRWVSEKRHRDPMNGWSRGHDWGSEVLYKFMPDWFQRWMRDENWHPVVLLGKETDWWSNVQAFGYTQDQWRHMISAYIRATAWRHGIPANALISAN